LPCNQKIANNNQQRYWNKGEERHGEEVMPRKIEYICAFRCPTDARQCQAYGSKNDCPDFSKNVLAEEFVKADGEPEAH